MHVESPAQFSSHCVLLLVPQSLLPAQISFRPEQHTPAVRAVKVTPPGAGVGGMRVGTLKRLQLGWLWL
jgi:hypothetical protein